MVVEADEDLAVDAAGTGAMALGAVVLASFEVLLPLFDGTSAARSSCSSTPWAPIPRRPYELMFERLSQKDQPLDAIHKASSGTKGIYGAGWDFDYERPKSDLFEMKVHRCLWRDFFTRHDAPLVNTVMCAWDTNWMRAIDPAVSGLRAERTALLSLVDSQCRFAVEETDDPSTGTPTRSTRASSTQKRSAPSRSTRRARPPRQLGANAGWCRRCTTRADDAAPRGLVVVPGGEPRGTTTSPGAAGACRLRWVRSRQHRVER
jgi:L-2-amino-thiazoline-4-carboxylic acid hydrolase